MLHDTNSGPIQDDDSNLDTSSSMSHIMDGNALEAFKGNYEACVEAR